MDELEISGKRYISAKRIARENKYHPDYVGQLIRGGRISGTKVGRAWYVDEQSFVDYLNKEGRVYESPVVSTQNQERVSVVASAFDEPNVISSAPASVVFEQEEHVPVETPEQNIATDFVGQETFVQDTVTEFVAEEENSFVPESPVVETRAPQRTSLTYISDNSPLFPAIQRRNKDTQKPLHEGIQIHRQQYIEEIPEVVTIAVAPRRQKRGAVKSIFLFTFFVALALLMFSTAFFGSLAINSTIVVEQGKPASVLFSQQKTFCFILKNCQSN